MQDLNNKFDESPHMGLAVAISLILVVLLMTWLAVTALATGIALI